MNGKMTKEDALGRMMNYCSRSEHCKSEVEDKLRVMELSTEIVKEILDRLLKERFLDEKRYCRSFVRDKFLFNRWGRVKIVQALRLKRLSDADIREGLQEIDEEAYLKVLKELLLSKEKSLKPLNDYDRRGKLIRFAWSRGFEMELINRCL